MGLLPFSIRHALCPQKGDQGSIPCRLSSSSSGSEKLKVSWRYYRWGFRIQYDLRRWVVADVLWWSIKNIPKGKIIAGVGVVFVSPQNHILPRAFSLTMPYSNNAAEYNALLIGLQLTHEMGYDTLRLMVTQSWSSIRLKENTRFRMKTWYLITMQSSKWPIRLMAFTSVMYLISKILRQMLGCTGGFIDLTYWCYLSSYSGWSMPLLPEVCVGN